MLKQRALAMTLALVMVASVVAPGLAFSIAPATAAASGPSDMVALGDGQVHEDLPPGADAPITADDLEGSVWASDHAGTMDITITTPDRAGEYVEEHSNLLEGDDIAVVVSDDEHHDARDVAVDAQLLEDALGYQPEAAFGVHSSGDEWSSGISYDGGAAVFEVPKFSENTVSFTGGITLSGENAVAGTSWSYDLDDLDGVDEYEINLTGHRLTEANQRTATTDSGTLDVDVGGTTAPEDAEVEMTGVRNESPENTGQTTAEDGDGFEIEIDGNEDPEDAVVEFTGNVEQDTATHSNNFASSTGSLSVSPDGNDPQNADLSIDFDQQSEGPKLTGTSATLDDGDDSEEFTVETGDVDVLEEAYIEKNDGGIVRIQNYIDGGYNSAERVEDEVLHLEPGRDVGDEVTIRLEIDWEDNSEPAWHGDTEIELIGEGGASTTATIDGGGDGTTFDSSGTYSVDITESTSEVDFSADEDIGLEASITYDDPSKTENPSLSVAGQTVEHSGILDGGETYQESISLDKGTHTGDVAVYFHNVDYNISWTEINASTNPSVEIADETVTHSGTLGDGETVNEPVNLPLGESTATIDSEGPIDVDINYTEVSETTDAGVIVNGNERTIDGTIQEGETESLPADEGWLEEGTNEVQIVTADAGSGPAPEVGLEYQHEAGSTSIEETVEASTWRESYNVSHTFASDQAAAEAKFAYADNVIEIRNLEQRTNGGEWQTVPESDYSLENSTLVVDLGDVAADTTVEIRATGGKIQTYDGSVNIIEPTAEGDALATDIEVTDVVDGGTLGIDVSETAVDDRIHYSSDESFEGSAHAEVTASGTQVLRAPDANAGSTMTIETMPVDVSPESGAMEVEVEQAGSEPRFQMREGDTIGAAEVEVAYFDTLSGERYVLWSETEDREVDADRASSPVFFTTDGSSETYSILQRDDPSTGGGGGGAPAESGSGLALSLILPAVAISVTGLWWAGRRFGGARGVRGNGVLLVGSSIIALVAAELVTARSLTSDLMFALGDGLASGAGASILAVAILLGLWGIDRRTGADVPRWIQAFAGVSTFLFVAEAIRPGSVLGPIEGALLEVGAALVIISLVGIIAVWWRRSSTPETEVTVAGGDQD